MLTVLSAILIAVGNLSSSNSTDSSDIVIKKLEKYNARRIREKVHLHTDRPYYNLGDTIWFKSYTVIGEKNLASNLSNYLYVELLKGDTVKQSLRLRLKNGMAAGDMFASDDWTEGNYRLRAYTNWMQNFGHEDFFEKHVLIRREISKTAATIKAVEKTKSLANLVPAVQFFPEGGSMINGIMGKVAFKVTGSDGLSREASGYLKDEQGNRLIDIKTEYAGMGNFSFLPSAAAKYSAVLTFKNGSGGTFQLPMATTEGYSLAVNNQRTERLIISVSASAGIRVNTGDLTLLGSYDGKVIYKALIKLDSSRNAVLAIQKKQLPCGILQLSLFDSKMKIRAERIVFLPTSLDVTAELKSEKSVYKKREKVNLHISSRDTVNESAAILSMAVIDETGTPFDDKQEVSIFTSLLLKGQIKGYIENPNHYFSEPSQEKWLQLDNLLLTQGWRRHSWDDVLGDRLPELRYWPEMQFAVTGKVTNRWKKPVAGATIIVLPAKAVGLPKQVLTDSLGKFSVDLSDYPDTSSFIVQAKNPKGTGDIFLELDKAGSAEFKISQVYDTEKLQDLKLAEFIENKADNSLRNNRLQNGVLLQTVAIKQKKVSKYKPPTSWNLNGAGNADKVVTGEQLKFAGTLENALYGYVRGYRGNFLQYSRGQEVPVTVYIDGSIISADITEAILASYTLEDIENIEIINAGSSYATLYGSRAPGGVLLINTKNTKYEIKRKYTPGLTYYFPKAVYHHREFYSPKYLTDKQNEQPDLRQTIYWNPEIRTDKKGNATVDFYTNDIPGTYKIVIEGLNASGIPLRTVARFKVE